MSTSKNTNNFKPLGNSVGIPPRKMNFKYTSESFQKYYFDGSPFISTMMTAMSAMFPAGESFFVEAVKQYRHQASNPTLIAAISGFIGQEAMHSKEHSLFNKVMHEQGYNVSVLEQRMQSLMNFLKRIEPPTVKLATTVCAEHYTAIIAEMLLRDDNVQQAFSEQTRYLWLWHALEECEHKSVAFDLLQEINPSYLLRAGSMIPTTIILIGLTIYFQGRLLVEDGKIFNIKDNLRDFWRLWGREGIFSRLLPRYLDFYKLDFHPNQHDTTALLAEWRNRLFNQEGKLYQVKVH